MSGKTFEIMVTYLTPLITQYSKTTPKINLPSSSSINVTGKYFYSPLLPISSNFTFIVLIKW